MRIGDRIKLIAAAGIFLGGLIFAGCEPQGATSVSPKDRTPEVAVVTLEPQKVVLTTELPGRTSSYLVAEIRPQVDGLIQKRLFTEGSDVKAGQVLYQIDPAPFEAAVANAAATLNASRKAADRARAALEASAAGVSQRRALLKQALRNYRRLDALFKDGAVSDDERERAETDAEVAEASLKAAEAQVESDRQALAAAEAAIEQAEAALQTARINLGYTKITAPISGQISRSKVTDGALVKAYQDSPLATIEQLNPMYVDVTQSISDLLELRRSMKAGRISHQEDNGKTVRLHLEDGSPYPLEGKLQFRDVTSVNPATGSYILRIEVPNPDYLLLPGMYVRAVVKEGTVDQAILAPHEGVTRNPKGEAIALIVDDAGVVQQKKLTIDRAVGNNWLVTSGLSAGDRVIVEGRLNVKPGQKVKVVSLDTEPDGQKVEPSSPNENPASKEAKK
jgi:membrane fusion protein (multidrug efflux system)